MKNNSFNGCMAYSVAILLSCGVLYSCEKASEVVISYHPIEKYVQNSNILNLTAGRKVAIIVNTNGCHACISQANDLVAKVNNPNVKLIYSVAHKGMIDREIEVVSQDSVTYYVDKTHTPFKKGMVAAMPVAYFLENGLMVDSLQLNDKTLGNVYEFVANENNALGKQQ
jgi:hypothetical protein